jgi:hypothetical protein
MSATNINIKSRVLEDFQKRRIDPTLVRDQYKLVYNKRNKPLFWLERIAPKCYVRPNGYMVAYKSNTLSFIAIINLISVMT